MSCREFSALLVGCDFVIVRRSTGGEVSDVRIKSSFQQFITDYINKDASSTREGLCELSPSNRIYIDALRDGTKSIDKKSSTESLRMHLLRIGAYTEDGESVNPTLQINDCNEPPSFNHRLRHGHRRLFNAIRPALREVYLGDDVEHVMKWVEMKDVLGGEEVKEDDDDEKKMPPRPPPPTPNNNADAKAVDPTPLKPPPQLNTTANITPSTAKKSAIPPMNFGAGNEEEAYKKLTTVGGDVNLSDGKSIVITARAQQLMKDLMEELQRSNPTMETAEMPPIPPPAAAAAAAASVSPTNNNINNNNITSEMRERFNLLATLALPVLSEPTPNEKIDMGSTVRSNLLRQLTEYMNSIEQPIQCESMNSKYNYDYIKVTTKKSDPSCPDIREGMNTLFGIGDEKKIIQSLVDYLLKYHGEAFRKSLRENRLTPKKMTVHETVVTMDETNLLPCHLRNLIKCLTCFMDMDHRMLADENEVRKLGENAVKPHYDTYHHPTSDKPDAVRELIKYWYKDPGDEFVAAVQGLIDGIDDFDPAKIEFINSCHGGDHATKLVGKFRMVAKCIIKYDGTYYVDMYSIADVES